MRRHVVVPVADALAHHQAAHQPGDACVDMHHRAAGVIQRAHGREPAGRRPHPVRDRRVGKDRPQAHEDAHRGEFHPLGERAGDQRRGDDRERHLEHHVDGFRNGVGHRGDARHAVAKNKTGVVLLGEIVGDAVEQEARHVAEIGRGGAGAVGERQRVADDCPDDGDQAADRERLHDGGKNILPPHHAGVKQGKARDGHHQHECGAGEHPGGVAMVVGRRLGRTGRGRCGGGRGCSSGCRRGCGRCRGRGRRCRGGYRSSRRGLGDSDAHRHRGEQQGGGQRQRADAFHREKTHSCRFPLRARRHRVRRCGCARPSRCRE